MFGQNVCNTRVQKNGTALSPASARKLKVKWTYAPTPAPLFLAACNNTSCDKASSDISATPAVVDGGVYVPDWGGKLSRVNAADGKETWSRIIDDLVELHPKQGRGLVSRTTPVVAGDAVIIGTQRITPEILDDQQPNAFMVAVHKDTGAFLWKTPLHDGHPAAIITGSPVLDGNRLYVGVSSREELFATKPGYHYSFRGSVAAIDAKNGKLLWQTHTIDDALYNATDTT